MANQIHIYTNNPTSAGTDGTQVSESGAQTAPVSVTLNATNAEVKAVKLAIRCDAGYQVSGDTVLTLTGTNAAKWALCADNSYADAAAALAGGTFSSSLTLSGVVATNTIFWAKAMSSTDETPVNDKTVSIQAVATIAATA